MSSFHLTLDTTPPAPPNLMVENGLDSISFQTVRLSIFHSDLDTSNYEMKIWGDLEPSFDEKIHISEVQSSWIPYVSDKLIKLYKGNGIKQIFVKVRDDLHNESLIISDQINLNVEANILTFDVEETMRAVNYVKETRGSISYREDRTVSVDSNTSDLILKREIREPELEVISNYKKKSLTSNNK